ncbi:O-methyltransferase [Parenemella sanctibonifatiensis]|uniref:Methyltransferase n=1 Tax=Parenemella sanctibonifatiensis TaxID=2016505 RepID=A0A255EN86_9ACTN|nr:O-methyltransferase [Parenemella sanctibonifatiensis]OYN89583.1 methyltransferase [Parenemella sanctibonifatiensis]OYN89737.1 methyltransferase [Parenemella sanctibonifatiensis]
MNHARKGRAPKAASWTWAETLSPGSEPATAARAAAHDLGIDCVSEGVAAALTVMAAAINATAVVEIGTGAGVSGLALFDGMNPEGVLTSVDIETEHQLHARQAFTQAGLPRQRYRLIAGEALTVLPKLSDSAYDMVLIDGDKLEYGEYVEQALRLLRPGGVLALHHALWSDKVADKNNDEDETIIIREAVEAITENEDLSLALLPVGDGLLLAVRR